MKYGYIYDKSEEKKDTFIEYYNINDGFINVKYANHMIDKIADTKENRENLNNILQNQVKDSKLYTDMVNDFDSYISYEKLQIKRDFKYTILKRSYIFLLIIIGIFCIAFGNFNISILGLVLFIAGGEIGLLSLLEYYRNLLQIKDYEKNYRFYQALNKTKKFKNFKALDIKKHRNLLNHTNIFTQNKLLSLRDDIEINLSTIHNISNHDVNQFINNMNREEQYGFDNVMITEEEVAKRTFPKLKRNKSKN